MAVVVVMVAAVKERMVLSRTTRMMGATKKDGDRGFQGPFWVLAGEPGRSPS